MSIKSIKVAQNPSDKLALGWLAGSAPYHFTQGNPYIHTLYRDFPIYIYIYIGIFQYRYIVASSASTAAPGCHRDESPQSEFIRRVLGHFYALLSLSTYHGTLAPRRGTLQQIEFFYQIWKSESLAFTIVSLDSNSRLNAGTRHGVLCLCNI